MLTENLAIVDSLLYEFINKELLRQQSTIELIASENFTSLAVMQAQGSVLTNKYAEGYVGKRYYGGCKFVDEVEEVAIERAKQLFNCQYANVQPHSGSQANQAVFLALLQPGDKILGMGLNSGGHLTHGATPNLSGKWFNSICYEVKQDDYLIDYDQIEDLAIEHKPKLIIAGFSAYTREIDFKRFREIADKINAYLLADIAHIAGLVATSYHSSPLPYAHFVTTTTHKTLRGPRGGLILSNDKELGKKINSAVFPGMQGGPLMHVIAAKAVAFAEALKLEYKDYIKQVIINAKMLASTLKEGGYDILTGGTDNHMVLVNLRDKNVTGKEAESMLEEVGITCNKNIIPFDTTSPIVTSGIRLGTSACTTRGFKESEFRIVGNWIVDILDSSMEQKAQLCKISQLKVKVKELCDKFPVYLNGCY